VSELELRTWFDDVAIPEGTVERLASVAREAVAPVARARRRRRATVAAVAAALGAAGAAVAYELLDDDGLSVPSGPPPARQARLGSALLSQLPWLFQPTGAPRVDEEPAQPSLAFPAGTTHEEALRSLFASVVGEGALPAGTRLGPPLPGRVAVALDPRRGVRIDLRAPWGYAVPSGRIRAPGFTATADVPQTTIRRVLAGLESGALPIGELPAGIRVEIPRLPDCQVRSETVPPPCRLSDGGRPAP
jgi:hypothetical protein